MYIVFWNATVFLWRILTLSFLSPSSLNDVITSQVKISTTEQSSKYLLYTYIVHYNKQAHLGDIAGSVPDQRKKASIVIK